MSTLSILKGGDIAFIPCGLNSLRTFRSLRDGVLQFACNAEDRRFSPVSDDKHGSGS